MDRQTDRQTDRVSNWKDFRDIYIRVFFEVLSRKFRFHKNLTSMMVALHDCLCTVHLWYFLAELFIEREVFQKGVVEKSRTHIWVSVFFFSKIFPLIWDNVDKYGRAGHATAIWRMRIACWVAKAANTRSQYVILIAVGRQQWLRERA